MRDEHWVIGFLYIVLAALVLFLFGCTDMIRPEDPEYLDKCVVYVEADGWIDIQPWMLENCYSIRLWVVM